MNIESRYKCDKSKVFVQYKTSNRYDFFNKYRFVVFDILSISNWVKV